VPLKRSPSGHALIDAVLEVSTGERLRLPFLLDTGASGSIVSLAVLPSILRAAVETRTDGEAIHSAAGQVTGDRDVLRARLHLGAWESQEIELTVLPLGDLAAAVGVPLGGIIGLDLLALGELRIDLKAKRLTLSAGESREPALGFASVPFRLIADALIVVDVQVDDVTAAAILDLGAAITVINQAAADGIMRPGAGGSRTQEAGTWEAAALGAQAAGVAAISCTLERIRMGAAEAEQFPVYIAELPVFETLGLHDTPALLLGLDFFADRIVVIDFSGRQVYTSDGPRGKDSDVG
jgi:predicted aspartyl protease